MGNFLLYTVQLNMVAKYIAIQFERTFYLCGTKYKHLPLLQISTDLNDI